MTRPATAIAAAEAAGTSRSPREPASASADRFREMARRPHTTARPTTVSTPARPRLKAATRIIPSTTLWNESAASNTTSAVGHGSSPPETPSASRAAVLVISLIGYGSARRDADRYAAVVANTVGARVVPLAPTAANGARGSLVVPANGAAPYLILDLPSAAAGKTWEAWVIRGDVPARAGLTDEHGLITMVLIAPLAPGDTVAITPEPAGGVDKPTGTAVLVGKS